MEWLLDRLFEYQEIRDGCEALTRTDGPVYLKRYFILKAEDADRSGRSFNKPLLNLTVRRKSNGIQIYLHRILRSDADRELHDHPWDFLSLMLWRGYREQTLRPCSFCRSVGLKPEDCSFPQTVLRRKWPGMVLFRRALHRHRVMLCGGPAWSLVFTSGKKRSWGFWQAGAFIPWRIFVSRKCEERNR